MPIEIDQSNHIEYTSKHTVIADSLGNYVYISAKEKRKLQTYFRQIGKPRIFVSKTFCALIAFLIAQTFNKSHHYLIDQEYEGHEIIFRDYIMRFSKRLGCNITTNQIDFGYVKKISKSHHYALLHFRNNRPNSQFNISMSQVTQLLER